MSKIIKLRGRDITRPLNQMVLDWLEDVKLEVSEIIFEVDATVDFKENGASLRIVDFQSKNAIDEGEEVEFLTWEEIIVHSALSQETLDKIESLIPAGREKRKRLDAFIKGGDQ